MKTARISQHKWTLPSEPLAVPSASSCWLAIAGSIVAFGVLVRLPHLVPGVGGIWLASILFVAIQLVVSVPAISSGWRSIFRRPTFRDIAIALACVPPTVILPAIVAFLVIGSANLSANPVIEGIGALAPAAVVNMFATSGVQLIGEELVTILPFLALVTLLNRLGFKPWLTIGLSWIVTSLAFGALHLPTYDWHVGQALIGIGLARVVLTGVFLLTKNLWASTVTHVVNDWLMLTISVLAGHAVH